MVLYLMSISCNKKNENIKQSQLDEILYHLKQCGVHIHYAVHEKHGYYNQLHTHAMVTYNGKFKDHTKYGNKEFDGYDFKVHWTPVTDTLGCIHYLEKTDNHIVSTIA